MTGNRIAIYHGDDWAVMFVNGVEHTQGHTIEFYDIKDLCPIVEIEIKEMPNAVDHYLADAGMCESGIALADFLVLQ